MTTTRHDAEVIVVGGGPAGSTLAFFLARAGCGVLVLDRAHFPRDKPCSEYLSPQALRLLAEMGVLDVLDHGPSERLTGMRVIAPDGTAFEGHFGDVPGYRAFRDYGLAVRRPILDATLLESARRAGARVLEGADVRDLVRDGAGRVAGVSVRVDGAVTTLRAPLVIGADGLRSVVARRAGLGRHGRWPRRVAFVTHLRGAHLDGPVGEMHVFADGYAGFAPVGDGVTNAALVIPSALAGPAGGDTEGFMRRAFRDRERLARRIAGAEWVGPVRAVGPFNWHAPRAWAPGLALVGDAADFFDPFTGEGIFAAMRGAELLATYAWEAVRAPTGHGANVALEAYDRCRRAEFRGKRAVERLVATAVASPVLMNRAARGLAAGPGLANVLVGVTGDFVPASEVLRARYILRLVLAAMAGTRSPVDHAPPVQAQPHLP